MVNLNPKVDAFIERAKQWRAEYTQLRQIVNAEPLVEELKWKLPCYSFNSSNIVVIQGFKEFCALMFFKGALLSDPNGILIQMTENTQAARQVRFTDLQEIIALEPVLKAYLDEAIEVEKANLKVPYKKTEEFAISDEFKQALAEDPALKAAFAALTPGRQRAYLLYFAAPKQTKTRLGRIDKYRPAILAGKGLND